MTETPATNATTSTPSTPGKRGRRPGTQPKVRLGIPAEFFKFRELDERETAEARRKREERSDQQKEVDEVVLNLWERYVAKGEPTNWADRPVFEWPVPVEHEETALFYIRKACQLYGRRQVLGDRVVYTDEATGIKMVKIAFSVERRRARGQSNISGD